MTTINRQYSLISIEKIIGWFNRFIYSIYYRAASVRNSYPCKLVGEKPINKTNDTTVLYRILGKRDIYEISIKDLLEDKELIAKFHPTEAVKFGAIALGDLLFGIPESERKQKYEEIRDKMTNAIKG